MFTPLLCLLLSLFIVVGMCFIDTLSQLLRLCSIVLSQPSRLRLIDIFRLEFSVLGLLILVVHLHSLLPHRVVPHISAMLNETLQLLKQAEARNAITEQSKYKIRLDLYEDLILNLTISLLIHRRSFASQFEAMHEESHRDERLFQQLRLALHGMTFRLIKLQYQFQHIQKELKVCQTTLQPFAHRTHSITFVPVGN